MPFKPNSFFKFNVNHYDFFINLRDLHKIFYTLFYAGARICILHTLVYKNTIDFTQLPMVFLYTLLFMTSLTSSNQLSSIRISQSIHCSFLLLRCVHFILCQFRYINILIQGICFKSHFYRFCF